MGRATEVRRRVQPVDLVIAVSLTISAQVEVWAPGLAPAMGEVTGSRPVLAVTSALMTLPLVVRRPLPLATVVVTLSAAVAQQLATTPTEGLSSLIALLVAAYSVSAHADRSRALLGGCAILVGSLFIGVDASDHLFVAVLLGAAWAMGWVVGHRGRVVGRLTADNYQLERQHDEAAARGAAEERVRIARDLHDVVAHRVSMMVVQAQAADASLANSPTHAREAVHAIEETGRQALEELRSLLGVLHAGSPDGARTPQPGLDDIERLVAEAGRAGIDVGYATHGVVVSVEPAVAMAAYRVVQESLTNVVKHAAGRPAQVLVRFGAEELEIGVTNEGPLITQEIDPGHGLAGMKERVRFAGGRFTSGPGRTGGFEVRATLPLREVTA